MPSPSPQGVKHYHELFACCKKYGVEPYVSLHHFDSPAALFNQGDWLNRKTVDAYVRYAEFCFREFREVKNWFTINELISLSHSQYIQGNFPPNHHFDVTSGIQSQHNELVAHARAVNLYKDLDETEHLGGRIGMVNVLTPAYPATDSPADQHAADLYNAFYTDFIMDGAFLGHYSARTLSLINEILRANNATLTVEDSDMEELAKAARPQRYVRPQLLSVGVYRRLRWRVDQSFNGTGDKGTSFLKFRASGSRSICPVSPPPTGIGSSTRKASTTRSSTSAPPIPTSPSSISPKTAWATRTRAADDKRHRRRIPSATSTLSTSAWRRCSARAEGVDVQGYFIWSLGPVLVGHWL